MTDVLKRKLLLPLAITAAAVLAGIPAVAQFGSSAPVQAASLSQPAQPARCSLATLKGAYVFSQNGVQATGSNPGPFAVAGTAVFDGHGHSQGFFSESTNGRIVRRISFTDTHVLNPDCTGAATVTDATGAVEHYDLYTIPSGSRVTFVQTDPGVVSSGTIESRQAASSQPAQPARCSLATLIGTYVFSHSGVQVTGSTKGPLAAVGTVVFDGRGHARGAVSESLNGKSARHVFTNTYTLNPDCAGTIMVTDVTGAVRHYDVYTSSSGSRYTFLRTDPGVVESGIAEKR